MRGSTLLTNPIIEANLTVLYPQLSISGANVSACLLSYDGTNLEKIILHKAEVPCCFVVCTDIALVHDGQPDTAIIACTLWRDIHHDHCQRD